MRAMSIVAAVIAGCGGAARPAQEPSAPAPAEAVAIADARGPDAAPDAGVADATPDAADAAIGAMRVPDDDDLWNHATLDEVDTTVSIDDVRGVRGPWPEKTTVRMGGRVMLALHAEFDGTLYLSVIEAEEASREDLAIEKVTPETFNHTFDGNAYLSRQGPEETGPLIFAARVLPPAGAPSSERVQIAVFSEGSSLRVVEKRMSETRWRPRMLLQLRAGATFIGIGTSDPH
jgi:hypothetical protein